MYGHKLYILLYEFIEILRSMPSSQMYKNTTFPTAIIESIYIR